jgi:X-X-X-Leu-X-X-Gly heptad repeat protein
MLWFISIVVALLFLGGIAIMATGLSALQAAVAALTTGTNQLIADVQKLLANQSPGLQPGQVIVNQADIDALTTSVTALTASEVAEDAAVNPSAAASPTSLTPRLP